MKFILHIFLATVFIGIDVKAQSPTSSQNYIIESKVRVSGKTSESQLNSLNSSQINRRITYFDGLGRSAQTINWKASPDSYDVVSTVAYDSLGRIFKEYLPYKATTNDLSFKTSAQAATITYYQGTHTGIIQTSYPFSETVYEKSPLDRVLQIGSPGADWQPQSGHTSKAEQMVNTAQGGSYPVKIFKAVPTTAQNHERELYDGGWFGANKLSVKIVKDENWLSGKVGTTEEYTDNEGRILLSKVWETSNRSLSTYYVYDDLGNLSYVLPAAAQPDSISITQNTLDNYCIQFRYDNKRRLVEKKAAGTGWEEFVYNPLDQLIISRNTKQRDNGKWMFTKYDSFGRAIITGVISSSSNRVSWQSNINGQTIFFETEDVSNSSGTGTGYTNNTYPAHNMVNYYHTINYYDDYTFFGNSSTFNPTLSVSSRTNGLVTATKTNILNSTTMLLSVMYYDEEGRMIESIAQNHISGLDRIVNTFNFPGEIITKVRTHSSSMGSVVVITNYEYDNNGRIIRKKQKTGSISSPEVVLSELTYNEIGQIYSKKLHSENNGSSYLLNPITYSYNERGWPTNQTSSIFSLQLKYQNGTYPQYNGNISNQLWGPGSLTKTFTYNYNNLNQLTSGVASGMSENGITYDKGGNITSLTRNGVTQSYNYTYGGQPGYKLASVTATGLANQPYVYDANGNATTDGSRNNTISYNILDLPESVTGTNLNVVFTYSATGEKLRKYNQVTGVTTDYVAGIQYESGSIEFIQTEEGLARNNSGTYSYEYTILDHLGNTRLTFHKDPNTGLLAVLQNEEYYPYGLRNTPGSIPSNFTNYLYAGKELQVEFGQYDHGARHYDPVTGRWLVTDPAGQFANPYLAMGNNPIMMADPDGKFAFIPFLIGAIIGAYTGGVAANNGQFNPGKWDWNMKTIGYMVGGALVGGLTGSISNAIATSGIPMANTAAIAAGSLTNSIGMNIVTGGKWDISIGFGFGSYNFSTGEFGYLGKKGNSIIANIGYGLGALANAADILAGFHPKDVQLNTANKNDNGSPDLIGHSAITKVGETSNDVSLISVGPQEGGTWIFNPLKFNPARTTWENHIVDGAWKVIVKGVNLNRITKYSEMLHKGINYNLYFSSCVNHTARALTLAGVPAFGIHPFILHAQMYLRSIGFRPALYSYKFY